MTRIGIVICARYGNCGGGKCLRALRERVGAFARYPKDEPVELVGYSSCGGCPGGNLEYVPEEMKKNGAQAVHLATGMVVGYPPCPRLAAFKELLEKQHGLVTVIGTHPVPLKYFTAHQRLPFWRDTGMERLAGDLLREDRTTMQDYD